MRGRRPGFRRAKSGLRPCAHQFEPYRAFELAGRLPAGARIEAALAGLAQVARGQRGAGLCVDLLAAALLDEDAVDRRLAVLERQILALPAVASQACGQEIAQEVGLVPVLRGVSRIADDADATDRSLGIDQHRDDD